MLDRVYGALDVPPVRGDVLALIGRVGPAERVGRKILERFELLKNLAPARLQLLRVWIRLRVGRIGEQRQFLLELLLGIAVDLGVVLGLQLREESVKDMLRVDLRVGRRELAPRAKGNAGHAGNLIRTDLVPSPARILT